MNRISSKTRDRERQRERKREVLHARNTDVTPSFERRRALTSKEDCAEKGGESGWKHFPRGVNSIRVS